MAWVGATAVAALAMAAPAAAVRHWTKLRCVWRVQVVWERRGVGSIGKGSGGTGADEWESGGTTSVVDECMASEARPRHDTSGQSASRPQHLAWRPPTSIAVLVAAAALCPPPLYLELATGARTAIVPRALSACAAPPGGTSSAAWLLVGCGGVRGQWRAQHGAREARDRGRGGEG